MSIIQFYFAFAIFIIAKLANGDHRISVLVIEANFPRGMSHYALHKKMVEDLASQVWVKKVVFLIPIVTEHERDLELEQEAKKQHSKLTVKHELVELKHEPGEKAEPWENINSKFEPGALTGTITQPDVFLELTKRKHLIDELKKEQFDVGIAEVFYYGAFPLLWLANVKNIVATSNMPSPPAFYHFMNQEYLKKIKDKKDIPEIFTNTFDQDVTNSMSAYNDLDNKFEEICHDKYNEKAEPPKFEDLFRQAKYYFINSQPFLDFKLPYEILQAEKLKFIGGMAALNNNSNGKQQNPDDEELAAIEQARQEEGLIIVSFGTVVETEKTPDQIFDILFDAFKLFPEYVFLWRFEYTAHSKQQAAINEHNAIKKHIYTKPWLKQTALLADPTTRLFISHCGINSLNEAALYGVPLVCIPFFGDQPYNAAAMAKRGLGAVVDIFDKNLASDHVHYQMLEALEQSANMQEAKKAMSRADPVGTFVNTIKTFYDEKNHQCVKFETARIEWLNYVAKHGDVKGNDTLKPAELATMKMAKCNSNISPDIIEEFVKQEKSLEEKQTRFIGHHTEVQDALEQYGLDDLLANLQSEFMAKGESGANQAVDKRYPNGTFVISAKKFLMEIFSAESEAAWLDIFAFMQLAPWKVLKFAFEASKIQSAALDQMVNEDIWHQHLAKRKPENGNSNIGETKLQVIGMRRVVIEGGGPNGLLAAIQLFRAGMDITLVNDRLEYTRPQIVGYDSNWMCLFRYFLGTKYDQIFENKNSSGLVNEERGILGIRYMEQALKKRLMELAKFVKKKSKMSKKKIGGKLDLLYGYNVTGLEMGKKEFNAILEYKTRRSRNTLATTHIPVDLFLCMGGAGDKLRANLLESEPVQRSRTVNYTNGIYRKMRVPKDQERKINFRGDPAVLFVKMDLMKTQLLDVKFDKLIKENELLLPANVRRNFNNFTQQLLGDKEENVFLFIENWEWFSLNTRTPKPVDKLLKEIEKHMRSEKIRRRRKESWQNLDGEYAGNGDSSTAEQYEVNIDPNGDPLAQNQELDRPFSVDIDPSGTRSFDVSVWTLPTGAVERTSPAAGGEHSVVVATLGDALVNTHFYSGGGMSTGRKGVELLVKSVNAVISGETKNKNDFATNLARDLKEVTNEGVMLTRKFIPNEIIPAVGHHQTNEMEEDN